MGEPVTIEEIRTPFGRRDGAFPGLLPDRINPRGGSVVERFSN